MLAADINGCFGVPRYESTTREAEISCSYLNTWKDPGSFEKSVIGREATTSLQSAAYILNSLENIANVNKIQTKLSQILAIAK